MDKTEVILVFDIGKTNKKLLLFNSELLVVHREDVVIEESMDEDGYPCEDSGRMEQWIDLTLNKFLDHPDFEIKGLNFSAYGATLAFLDGGGNRITPLYNYLKPIPGKVLEGFFEKFGGEAEFCRKTASPLLGMLNSGLQVLWLKRNKPEAYGMTRHILHLPQYLSYRVTGRITSEHTSLGCHTMMWDFDRMTYHPWLGEEGIILPEPGEVSETFMVEMANRPVRVGKGIHDSSASLAPFILSGREPFVLVSTGTWCISMNPFNHDPLTEAELKRDCLSFLSVKQRAVKSSRFFLGRIHDLNVEWLESFFNVKMGSYRSVEPGAEKIHGAMISRGDDRLFFRDGIPEGYVDRSVDLDRFVSFGDAYLHLMKDLTAEVVSSIDLILPEDDITRELYITGGFTRNPIFTSLLASAYPGKKVYTAEMDDGASLGAAMVIADQIWDRWADPLESGLRKVSVP